MPKWSISEDEFNTMVNIVGSLDAARYTEAYVRAIVEKCAAMREEAGDGRLPVELNIKR